MKLKIAALISLLLVAAPLAAHEILKGPNGGRLVRADAHNVELIVNGNVVIVYVTDSAAKPVAVGGFRAHAMLMAADGKEQRIVLEPQEVTRLSGKSPIPLPSNGRGVVHLTTSDGKTAQVRYHALRDAHQQQGQ